MLGLCPRSSWLRRSLLARSRVLPSLKRKKKETVRSLRLSSLSATFYPASSLVRLLDQEDKVIEALLVVVATYLSADVIIL